MSLMPNSNPFIMSKWVLGPLDTHNLKSDVQTQGHISLILFTYSFVLQSQTCPTSILKV